MSMMMMGDGRRLRLVMDSLATPALAAMELVLMLVAIDSTVAGVKVPVLLLVPALAALMLVLVLLLIAAAVAAAAAEGSVVLDVSAVILGLSLISVMSEGSIVAVESSRYARLLRDVAMEASVTSSRQEGQVE